MGANPNSLEARKVFNIQTGDRIATVRPLSASKTTLDQTVYNNGKESFYFRNGLASVDG